MKIDYTYAWSLLLTCKTDTIYHNDVNTQCWNIIQVFKDFLGNKQREYLKRSYNNPVCPWITNRILDLLKTKDYWYHKWTHNKNNSFYLSEYKKPVIEQYWRCVSEKKDYYSGMIEQAAGNSKRMWQVVNEVNCQCIKQSVTEALLRNFIRVSQT